MLLLRGCAIAGQETEEPIPIPEDISAVIAVYDDENDLCGVVAAEMPASFEPEALKAQAIAARTFTLRHLAACGGTPCGRLGADICTDSACCQSYRSPEQLAEKWGTDAEYYSGRIREAVYGTAGEVATYDGELIEALYHSTAGGVTENSENVFASAEPYLVSVASPGEEGTAHYAETTKALQLSSMRHSPRRAFPKKSWKSRCGLSLAMQAAVWNLYRLGRLKLPGGSYAVLLICQVPILPLNLWMGMCAFPPWAMGMALE